MHIPQRRTQPATRLHWRPPLFHSLPLLPHLSHSLVLEYSDANAAIRGRARSNGPTRRPYTFEQVVPHRSNPHVLFTGMLEPNERITLMLQPPSSRCAINVLYDGVLEERWSACCPFKYSPGNVLGGSSGIFRLLQIFGGEPCAECVVQHSLSRADSDADLSIEDGTMDMKEDGPLTPSHSPRRAWGGASSSRPGSAVPRKVAPPPRAEGAFTVSSAVLEENTVRRRPASSKFRGAHGQQGAGTSITAAAGTSATATTTVMSTNTDASDADKAVVRLRERLAVRERLAEARKKPFAAARAANQTTANDSPVGRPSTDDMYAHLGLEAYEPQLSSIDIWKPMKADECPLELENGAAAQPSAAEMSATAAPIVEKAGAVANSAASHARRSVTSPSASARPSVTIEDLEPPANESRRASLVARSTRPAFAQATKEQRSDSPARPRTDRSRSPLQRPDSDGSGSGARLRAQRSMTNIRHEGGMAPLPQALSPDEAPQLRPQRNMAELQHGSSGAAGGGTGMSLVRGIGGTRSLPPTRRTTTTDAHGADASATPVPVSAPVSVPVPRAMPSSSAAASRRTTRASVGISYDSPQRPKSSLPSASEHRAAMGAPASDTPRVKVRGRGVGKVLWYVSWLAKHLSYSFN